ncbi:MAG: hypothetical protein KAS49_06175 [Candidatus Cloacimonetes bacterium]|nr:hypothetical protein [Candidatus Cloacimonadota bacterium]
MRKLFFLIIVGISLVGCSTQAEINIINRTNNNLYIALEGESYVLEGSENKVITIDTGKRNIFSEEITKVELQLEGETFMMQLGDPYGYVTGEYYNTTDLELKQNETRNIYCDPTHAGFKVYNNFGKLISSIKYFANNDTMDHVCATDLEEEDFAFQQLRYYTDGDTIYYTFELNFDDGSHNVYGGPGNLMELDELFYIDKDTEKK